VIAPLFSPWKVLGLDCRRTRKYSIQRAAHCVLVRIRYVSHWSASDNVVRWVRARMGANLRASRVLCVALPVKLYHERKTEILEGKKLPEQLRGRVVRFAEIADDALAYCKANNQGQQFDAYRIGRLKDEFGNYPAEIPAEDLRRWFSE
jgi:hypothetical protein